MMNKVILNLYCVPYTCIIIPDSAIEYSISWLKNLSEKNVHPVYQRHFKIS